MICTRIISLLISMLFFITAGAQLPSLVLQKGHFKKINSTRFSANGTQMVTTSDDGIIKIWDAFSQKLVTELGGNGVVYLDAFFSADGKRIIANAEPHGEGGELGPGRDMLYNTTPMYVWDIETGQLVYAATNINEKHSISPDSRWVAIHTDKIKKYNADGKWQTLTDPPISIYHAATGRLLKQLVQYKDTSTAAEPFIAFISDSLLLTGIQTMAMLQGRELYITKYRVLNFFTDTETIDFNDTSTVYKAGGLMLSRGRNYFFRYNSAAHLLLTPHDNRDAFTELWSIQQRTMIWRQQAELRNAGFSANDSVITMLYKTTAGGNSQDDASPQKMLYFFLKDTLQVIQLPGDYAPDVISTSANGQCFFATAQMDVTGPDTSYRIQLWDSTHQVISSGISKNPVTAVTFSPNDRLLVTGYADGNISLWDFKDATAREVAGSSNIIDPVIQLHISKAAQKIWYITRGMYAMQDAGTINKLSVVSSGLATVKNVHYLLNDKYSILNLVEKYQSNGSFLIINNDTPSVVKTIPYDADAGMPLLPGADSNRPEMTGNNKWRIKLNYPGLQSFSVYNTASDIVNPNRNMFIQTASLLHGVLKSTKGTDTTLLITSQENMQYNDPLKSYVFTYDVPYAIRKAAPKDIVYPVSPKASSTFLPAPIISDDGRYLLGRDFSGKNTDAKLYYCQDLKSNIVFTTPVAFLSETLGIVSKFAISPNKKLACILSDPALSLGGHFVRVVNAQNGVPLYNLKMNTSGAVNGVAYTPDSKYVYTWMEGGTFTKWNLANGREIFTMVFFKDHDYAIILPDGYYFISSRTDAKYLNFKLNNKLYNFSQFDLQFNRPDKVLQAIGSTDKSLMDEYYKAWLGRIKKSGFTENDFGAGNLHVPSVTVNAANMQPFTTTRELPLAFTVADSLFTVKSYNIFINDVPLNGINGKLLAPARRASITQNILLSQGMNKIEISCTNENGAVSRKEALYVNYTPQNPPAPKTYFIGIGINRYSAHSSFTDLSYCVKDVRDLSAAFQQKFINNMVIDTLMNESATKENILALKQKLLQTSEDDKVIISFSGHGMVDPLHPDDFYFVTGNTDVNNPAENGISYTQLEELLDSIPARKKLLLLDACHSGEPDGSGGNPSNQVPGTKKGNDSSDKNKAGSIEILDVVENNDPAHTPATDIFKLMKEAFVDIRRNNGAYVLSAAQSSESAGEGGGIANGWFTSCLIEQLQKNGSMSINELSVKVGQCVSAKSGGNQNTDNRQELAEFNWLLW